MALGVYYQLLQAGGGRDVWYRTQHPKISNITTTCPIILSDYLWSEQNLISATRNHFFEALREDKDPCSGSVCRSFIIYLCKSLSVVHLGFKK